MRRLSAHTLLLFVVIIIASIAAMPATLAKPSAPTALATGDPGVIRISWDRIEGAQYYTVGWINWTRGQPVSDAGGDWHSLFHYSTVPGNQTGYTVSGLTGDENHHAIIRATDEADGRFGGGYSEWSGWSSAVQPAPAPQPSSDEATIPGRPTASAECYVRQTLTPGQACWFRLPNDVVNNVFAVTDGGPYHGWGQMWLDDWFRFFQSAPSQSATVDGVRHRFRTYRDGSTWEVIQYGPDS